MYYLLSKKVLNLDLSLINYLTNQLNLKKDVNTKGTQAVDDQHHVPGTYSTFGLKRICGNF